MINYGKQLTTQTSKQAQEETLQNIYNTLLKKITFQHGIPPRLSQTVFEYCAKQNKFKAEVYMKQEFKKNVKKTRQETNDYKCKICDTTENLTLHHRKPKSTYPYLAFDINNIDILCDNCHKIVHKTGADYTEVKKLLTRQDKKETTLPIKEEIILNINLFNKIKKGLLNSFHQNTISFKTGDIIQLHKDSTHETLDAVVTGIEKQDDYLINFIKINN